MDTISLESAVRGSSGLRWAEAGLLTGVEIHSECEDGQGGWGEGQEKAGLGGKENQDGDVGERRVQPFLPEDNGHGKNRAWLSF